MPGQLVNLEADPAQLLTASSQSAPLIQTQIMSLFDSNSCNDPHPMLSDIQSPHNGHKALHELTFHAPIMPLPSSSPPYPSLSSSQSGLLTVPQTQTHQAHAFLQNCILVPLTESSSPISTWLTPSLPSGLCSMSPSHQEYLEPPTYNNILPAITGPQHDLWIPHRATRLPPEWVLPQVQLSWVSLPSLTITLTWSQYYPPQ